MVWVRCTNLFPSARFGPKVIYSFQGGRDGRYPYGLLATDSSGDLYGTTSEGGTGCGGFGCGTVYELRPKGHSWRKKVLYRFKDASDGHHPGAGVILDSSGNIYGTTGEAGRCSHGALGNGSVFKLSPSETGWTE